MPNVGGPASAACLQSFTAKLHHNGISAPLKTFGFAGWTILVVSTAFPAK
jgi:hypothetical protein